MEYIVSEYETGRAVFITDDIHRAKVMSEILMDKTGKPHIVDVSNYYPTDAVQQEAGQLQLKLEA